MSRSLDDLVTSTEHAKPLHPVRELVRSHFYLDGFVNTEGGLWLVLLNALLFVPLVMAAFFYPVAVLVTTGVVLLVMLAAWEGYVFWRRRHIKA
jgi:hypothetical protein